MVTKLIRYLELALFAMLLLWILKPRQSDNINCREIPTDTGPWFVTTSWR